MTEAKRLSAPKQDFGQCEAERIHSYYKAWEKAHPDRRCKHGASFEIDGHRYCYCHAGIMALKILCGEYDHD